MVASAPPQPRQNPIREHVAPLLVRGYVHAPVCGCQYRGVYRHRARWRATVKLHGRKMHHVGSAETPLEAARLLADYFARWLGPDWRWIVATHRRHLWSHAPWRARHSGRRRGWLLYVWLDGELHRVGCPDAAGNDREQSGPFRGEPRAFPSREAAESHLHPFVESRGGVARMWRHRAQVPRPEGRLV